MENPKIRFKGFTKDWEQRKLGEVLISLQSNTLNISAAKDLGLDEVKSLYQYRMYSLTLQDCVLKMFLKRSKN